MAGKVLLFDQFSQPIELPKKLDASAQSTVAEKVDRSASTVLRDISPDTYERVFRNTAPLADKQAFMDRVYYDGHFLSIASDRASTISAWDWEVLPFTSRPGEKAKPEDQKIADSIAEKLCGAENLTAYFEHLAWGELYFVNAAETIFDPGSYLPVRFELVDGVRLNWHEKQVKVLTDAMPREGEVLRPGNWTVHSLNLKNPNKARLARALAFWHMLTRFGVVDYAALSEKYGKPIPIAYFSDEGQRDALVEALIQIGESFVGAFPEGTKVDLTQAVAAKKDIVEGLITLGYDQGTKAACGHVLVVEAKSGNGTLGGNGAQMTNQKVARGVASRVADAVRQGPIRTLAYYHHGPKTLQRLPVLAFKARNVADETERARSLIAFNAALAPLGLAIDSEHIKETAGVPKLVPRIAQGAVPVAATTPGDTAPAVAPADTTSADTPVNAGAAAGDQPATTDAGVATTQNAPTGVVLAQVLQALLDVAAGTLARDAAIKYIKGAGWDVNEATAMVDAQINDAKPAAPAVQQPASTPPPATDQAPAAAQQKLQLGASADRTPKIRTVTDVVGASVVLDERMQMARATRIRELAQKALDDGISVAAFRDQLWELADTLDTAGPAEALLQGMVVASAIGVADAAVKGGK